jgi:TRAP-type C4-dicarboxylate transport system permease small subunit
VYILPSSKQTIGAILVKRIYILPLIAAVAVVVVVVVVAVITAIIIIIIIIRYGLNSPSSG